MAKDKPSHEDIVELMMETIIELEDAIVARPSGRREKEAQFAFDGFQIIEIEEEAAA